MTGLTHGRLVQVDPEGPTLPFQFNPTSLVRSGRLAQLDQLDRPRRTPASEWVGRSPWEINFTLRLDGFPDTSIHPQLSTLEAMSGAHRPDQPPPKVRLVYSGASPVRYVITGLSWGNEVRRADLAIVRVDVDVTLAEWVEPDTVVSPAAKARDRAKAADAPTTARTHRVVSGDTLWALAVRYLGSGPRWEEIATLNSIRDPRALKVGTELRIPPR